MAGYVSVRLKFLGEPELGALTRYLMGLALPALLLNAVATRHFDEVFDVAYAGAYLFGSLAAFAIGYFVSRLLFKSSVADSTFDAMGCSSSNSGLVGFPILSLIMPTVAPLALAMNMMIENLVVLPIILALAEGTRGSGLKGVRLARQIVKRVMGNPIMIGMVIGLAISLVKIDLPLIITKPIELMAASATALSLVIIGGTLALLPSGGVNMKAFAIAFGKLVLHPVGVLVGLTLMAALGAEIKTAGLYAAALIMAAMPQMGLYVMFSRQYGDGRAASFTMFISTMISFFTLSALLWYLGVVPH